MHIRWLQQNFPWQSAYIEAFESGPVHNHFAHNVLHLIKAVEKLAAAVEPLDHYNDMIMGHTRPRSLMSSSARFGSRTCALSGAPTLSER